MILRVGLRGLRLALTYVFEVGAARGAKRVDVGEARGAKYKFEINRQISQRLATLRKRLR